MLGIHRLDQLTKFALKPEKKKNRSIFASDIEATIAEAIELPKKLRRTPIRDIQDVQIIEQQTKKPGKKSKIVNTLQMR